MNNKYFKYLVYPFIVIILALVSGKLVQAATRYVDPTDRWAWGTNIGWINFNPTHSEVTVYDDHLEGYAWAENVGWIRMGTHTGGGIHSYANNAASNYGINNDGAGNLSGFAWGTNIGWINFNPSHSQVVIDPSTGVFSGYAWSENAGWIRFSNMGANPYQVRAANSLQVVSGGVTAQGEVVTDGKVLRKTTSSFSVEFTKDVYDPPGDSDPDDITNPDNYLLVQTGSDGVFDTIDCGSIPGAHPNDISIPVGPVSYSNGGGSGPFISTFTVNNGSALVNGEYRLHICGTSSIVDLNSVALAGDGVTSGTDLVITFDLAVLDLPDTGFAPNRITNTRSQPAENQYHELGNLWLEIPAIDVKHKIVGVPLTGSGWDVAWLEGNIGYLEGTAYPTWAGNTALTGHVFDADGRPGPFVDLGKLFWGNKVIIHAWDKEYTYSVRTIAWRTTPDQSEIIFQHEEYDWITLITCRGYDLATDSYQYRTIVSAVLVDVASE